MFFWNKISFNLFLAKIAAKAVKNE